MPRFITWISFLLGLALLVSGCSSAQAVPTQPASPTPPGIFPDSFYNLVDVGSYRLELECKGRGSPTVVLDSELAAVRETWNNLIPALSNKTRVCTYNRPGIDQSDPASKPRTSAQMAGDLHLLLLKAGVPGPYLLVGQGIAAFNIILYANTYPGEVVGLVLVDGSHPDQYTRTLAILPTPGANEDAALAKLRQGVENQDPLANPEGYDFAASAGQVRAVKSLGSLPLAVLSRHPLESIAGLPQDVVQRLEQAWTEMQNELAALSSHSTHQVSEIAGHAIPAQDPNLIIDAIFKMLDGLKK